MLITIIPGKLSGIVPIPASKSDGQRALLCAAVCQGTSQISGLGTSDDELAMLQAIQDLGAVIVRDDTTIQITGITRITEPKTIAAGESGLGFRLLCGVAGRFSFPITVQASGSLCKRPMHFFEETLPRFGVAVKSNQGYPPVTIQGKFSTGLGEADGGLSSQYISGLLFGLAASNQEVVLKVTNLRSSAYVAMTMHTLRQFGIEIYQEGNTFRMSKEQIFQPARYTVESDWSSASYWLVAAALGHEILLQGLDLESLQADKSLLIALQLANCEIKHESGFTKVIPHGLQAFDFDATDCPDLFPALVVLASQCVGLTKIHGVHRLKHKESNRGEALRIEMAKMGLQLNQIEDSFHIFGPVKLQGNKVFSHNDHRIAMCLAIAGSIADGDTLIDGAENVAKSYPEFWLHFSSLTTNPTV